MSTEQQTTALAIPGGGLTPEQYDQYLHEAHLKAKALAGIVNAQQLYTQIGTNKYLHIEAWITIAAGYGYQADIEWTKPLPDGGFEARAVVQNPAGLVVGHAEAECGSSGDVSWIGKPAFQQRSMAQTRAISKALAAKLRWVVVLAGYAPTPAEEMVRNETEENEEEAPRGLCPIHERPFVHRQGISAKTGAPYDFWACPQKDGNRYCQEKPQEQESTAPEQDSPFNRSQAPTLEMDWPTFYDQAEKLGCKPPSAIWERIGVSGWPEWKAKGGTQQSALDEYKILKG